jgi:hypothetical protein
VRFEGWTTEDWIRFLNLWQPRATPEREPTRPRGGVIVVHEDGQILKLVHTQRGRLDPAWALDASPPDGARALALRTGQPAPLADLASAHHASWALGLRLGALDEVMERFGARVRRADDITDQALLLCTIVREMMNEGAIASWPQRLRGFPVPSAQVVLRTLDALCADGRAITLGLFDPSGLWTCFVARRRGRGFDVIAGPDELRPELGLLSGDWRRDYRHLVRAVEDRYAPLAFGCFSEVETFRTLQVDGRAGAWARAMLVRDVVLSPIPVAVGLALGADGARYAFEHVRVITNKLDPFGFLDPVLRGVRARLGTAAGDKDVTGTLGFDPMAALRALLKR